MAINLADKYSGKIAEKFAQESIVQGKCSKEWDFSGVKTIKIYTPQTVDLNDYTRSGINRYGTPTEMGDTVQEMTMTQDKSFAMTIDKGNNTEQMMIKNAGKMMNLQLKERVVPFVDKYALNAFAHKAGKIFVEASEFKKANDVFAMVCAAEEYMTDNLIPQSERYLYISGKAYNQLRQSEEFLKNNEEINKKVIEKGVVGEVVGFKVVKVPTSYLPAGVNFIACYKNSVLLPYKIKDNKIHTDPPGISGALLEGRNLFDAFVIGERANGVYVSAYGITREETPVVTETGSIEGSGTIYYTVDGSDPRYSMSRKVYSGSVEGAESGVTLKAYTEGSDNKYPSDVAKAEIK